MSNKPTHTVLLVEDGSDKPYFTDIGSAWLKDSGNISVQVRPGLSVSGNFLIKPVAEDEAEG